MKKRNLLLLTSLLSLGIPAVLHAAGKAVSLPVEQADGRQALAALRMLFSAHATGNRLQVAALVELQMLGYSRVMDSLPASAFSQQQSRVALSNIRTQASEDSVTIQTHWEKRFVAAATRTPVLKTGDCTFVMRRSDGTWKLSAFGGDNPFAAN